MTASECSRRLGRYLPIHRWNYDMPIEETMEALHDFVKAGSLFRHNPFIVGVTASKYWSSEISGFV